jgi:cytochrome c oxidase subunit 3
MSHSSSHSSSSTEVVHPPAYQPDMFGAATHGKVGMWTFLVTDAMTFSGALIAYAILRARTPGWPHASDYLGIKLSAFATFILICSSVTMVMAQAAGENREPKKMLKFLLLTALGGISFLSIQAHEYSHLGHEMGMTLSNFLHGPPQFASIFFVTTGFHGFHVFSGVVYLLIISFLTWRGRYNNGNCNEVEICGLFWHFVDLIWILVFTFIYLI